MLILSHKERGLGARKHKGLGKQTLKLDKGESEVMSNSLQPPGLSPPGSSVHGILQARILEWVAISFSRGSS